MKLYRAIQVGLEISSEQKVRAAKETAAPEGAAVFSVGCLHDQSGDEADGKHAADDQHKDLHPGGKALEADPMMTKMSPAMPNSVAIANKGLSRFLPSTCTGKG